jgi:CRP-like cAMP-binding protein
MTLETDIDVLRKVAFFAELPPEPLRLLAFSADTRELADRSVLFEAGDVADVGYVVMQGRIDLFRTEGGSSRLQASLGPSTLIGELALVVETTRSSRAISVGRSRVMLIRRSTFRRILSEYPGIAESIQGRIVERLSSLSPELDRIRNKLTPEEQG